jgi:hypothetical protein
MNPRFTFNGPPNAQNVRKFRELSMTPRGKAVPKTAIRRDDLRDRVLAEIRQHPGCGTIKQIAITPTEIVGASSTWHVNIIDSGESEIELACTVARQVQERWCELFEIVG